VNDTRRSNSIARRTNSRKRTRSVSLSTIRNGINTILNKLENDTDDDVDTREVVSSQILASPKTSSALDIIQLIFLAVLTTLVIFTTGAGL